MKILERTSNAVHLFNQRVLIMRRQRSGISKEWHNYGGVRYLNLTVGSKHHHRWWAFQVWVYITR